MERKELGLIPEDEIIAQYEQEFAPTVDPVQELGEAATSTAFELLVEPIVIDESPDRQIPSAKTSYSARTAPSHGHPKARKDPYTD